MGLDINFFRVAKEADLDAYKEAQEKYNKAINANKDDETLTNMYEELKEKNPYVVCGNFRKVNFLMSFFDYEDDKFNWIDQEEFGDLIDTCQKVLDGGNADELLPTCGGFFFGSTKYDECYYEDVRYVLEWANALQIDWENERLLMDAWY